MDNKEYLYCLQCDGLEKVVHRETKITHNIKGVDIVVDANIPYCSKCDQPLSDLDIEEQHFEKALSIYRKLKNLLSPEEIVDIRKSYGLSQRAFARALGIAESTMNKYELGAIQDSIHNNLILLAKEPKNMLKLASQNRENLTKKEFNLIQQNVDKLVNQESIHVDKNMVLHLISKIEHLEKMLEMYTH